MPAVVRGGRRQEGRGGGRGGAPRGPAPKRGRPKGPAGGVPGKLAAIGRLDLSPRAVMISIAAGVAVLALVMTTGSRAEKLGEAASGAYGDATAAMGLKLKRVRIEGASPAVRPQVQAALDLTLDAPMTTLDLDAAADRVRTVGWVRDVRVVRLYPDLLMVQVAEHDRLAVWQDGERAWVIDGSGRPIPGADAGAHAELPLVVGQGADVAAPSILPLIAERPRLAARVDALVRVDERRWDVRLKDGALIRLPAQDEEAALIALDGLDARRGLFERGFDLVDLRTAGAVVVRDGAAGAVPPEEGATGASA